MARRVAPSSALALVLILALASSAPRAAAAAEGQITFALNITLAPTWFDPAETPGVITPFLTLYALHDALVKPMPGNAWAPSLAESWTMSKDGLVYEFVLRRGVRFHNGDVLTADDVKFSFERYKGGGAASLKSRVAAVDIVDPQRIRFRLKQPWPDFMTFYASPATSAEEIRGARRRRRLQESARRRWPVPVRVVHAGHRARGRGIRRLLAQSAAGEAAGVQIRAGRFDAAGDAQAR